MGLASVQQSSRLGHRYRRTCRRLCGLKRAVEVSRGGRPGGRRIPPDDVVVVNGSGTAQQVGAKFAHVPELADTLRRVDVLLSGRRLVDWLRKLAIEEVDVLAR